MKFKRFLVMICICSLCICMTANVKARADAFPSASEILTLQPGIELTGIANAYNGLTGEQKLIAHYIIGAFNNIYLCARGFSYNIDQDETAFKAQFLAMGNLVFQYVTTAYGWKSRFNEVFRQYLSSAIVYASGISTTFEAWYQGVKQGGTNQLYIPYSQEAFDAWTEWYNDPSGDGIASLGEVISDWDSGDFYDFLYTGYPWNNNNSYNYYNSFVLYQSPVMYTPIYAADQQGNYGQYILSFKNVAMPDCVFITRQDTNHFRYGFFESLTVFDGPNLKSGWIVQDHNNNKIYFNDSDGSTYFGTQSARTGIISNNNITDYDSLVTYAFHITPWNCYFNFSYKTAYDWYPYLTHVVIVDDLNTLANPEEIYNTEGLNIVAPPEPEAYYMVSPNGLFISPIWPTADGDPMGFWDIVQDNSYNFDTELPASDDDFKQTIVNNTTINNYYVTDSDKINVPVEWFENDLTDQLAQDSIPFLQFARDCIDCLGDLQIYLYGAVVFGLAGGILKKFLL